MGRCASATQQSHSRQLGRAKPGREWLCGGIVLNLALAEDPLYLWRGNLLGQSYSRCVGAQVGGDAIASGSAGIVTTLSPAHVVKGPTESHGCRPILQTFEMEDARR